MSIMWTVLTWIFYPFLSYRYGYIGTAVATLIVGSSSFVVWYLARKVLDVEVIKTILHPTIASLAIVFSLLSINLLHLNLLITIITKIILGAAIYIIYSYIFSKKEIDWFLVQIKCLVNKKSS